METCSVVLTVESANEILSYESSNETPLAAVLLHGNIYFSMLYMK